MAGKLSWNHGHSRGPITEADYRLEDRGFATACWIWKSLRSGYGRIKISGQPHGAHRVAWEQVNGNMLAGEVIDHLCNQPSCVNPAHLRAVPQRENVRRSAATKLSHFDVIAMRLDTRTQQEIAHAYGVSQQQVSKIKLGTRWEVL